MARFLVVHITLIKAILPVTWKSLNEFSKIAAKKLENCCKQWGDLNATIIDNAKASFCDIFTLKSLIREATHIKNP